MKPHIRLVRGYWCIFRGRGGSFSLMGLTPRFSNLCNIGPWRDPEIKCEWVGDAKSNG